TVPRYPCGHMTPRTIDLAKINSVAEIELETCSKCERTDAGPEIGIGLECNGSFRDAGGDAVTYQWVDCDRHTVSRRYDRISRFIPLIDRMFFLPRGLRRQATEHLGLSRGDSVLEIGCGTGNSFAY